MKRKKRSRHLTVLLLVAAMLLAMVPFFADAANEHGVTDPSSTANEFDNGMSISVAIAPNAVPKSYAPQKGSSEPLPVGRSGEAEEPVPYGEGPQGDPDPDEGVPDDPDVPSGTTTDGPIPYLEIRKVNSDGEPLDGAEFTVYRGYPGEGGDAIGKLSEMGGGVHQFDFAARKYGFDYSSINVDNPPENAYISVPDRLWHPDNYIPAVYDTGIFHIVETKIPNGYVNDGPPIIIQVIPERVPGYNYWITLNIVVLKDATDAIDIAPGVLIKTEVTETGEYDDEYGYPIYELTSYPDIDFSGHKVITWGYNDFGWADYIEVVNEPIPENPTDPPPPPPVDSPTPTPSPSESPTPPEETEEPSTPPTEEPTTPPTDEPTTPPITPVNPYYPPAPPPRIETNTLVSNEDGDFVEFDEDGVPLGTWKWDSEIEEWVFFDGEIPLGALKTGDNSHLAAYLAVCAAALGAAIVIAKPRRKSRR